MSATAHTASGADVPARGSLRALLPALAGHRAMAARTCAAALVEQGSLVALLTLAAHTVGAAVVEGRAPSAATVTVLAALAPPPAAPRPLPPAHWASGCTGWGSTTAADRCWTASN